MNYEKKKILKQYALGLGVIFAVCTVANNVLFTSPQEDNIVGTSSKSNLENSYVNWSENYEETSPAGPVLSMLWTEGLSDEYSPAKGIAQFNFEKDIISVRIKGLTNENISDVWLVDNVPGKGRSVMPEDGDNFLKVGTLKFDGENAVLDANVEQLQDFPLDMIVLTRKDGQPGKDGVLYGTTSLFQKLYHYPERVINTKIAQEGASLISTANAIGITPNNFFDGVDSDLINRGRELFFEETFDGNGRTCGTCHKEDDNMALSIKTIANLPDDDPLFIVEQRRRADGTRNPLFNDFRMERPELMRKLGLIFENLDGFRELDGTITTRGVMRAPMHVLSTRTTIAVPPAIAFDDGTLPLDIDDLEFADRTGWAGDGTPTGFHEDFFESNGRELTGSLRDFSIGGIIQHFPLTIERDGSNVDDDGNRRKPDFRFATEDELDAMEAFMLSIGRQVENDSLDTYTLTDEVADRGRLNYGGFNVFDTTPDDGRAPLNCNSCHFNGGANTDPTFPFVNAVTPNHDLVDIAANGGSIPSHNRSFGPQVERLLDQPADIIVQVSNAASVAGDCFENGFAEAPLLPDDIAGTDSAGCDANVVDNGYLFSFDDERSGERAATNRFNAQPVFEAMDNPPFFHGHQINTIEGAVAFYATQRTVRNGELLPAIIPLNGSQVVNVARFMRVMGADFNIESAITLLNKAEDLNRNSDVAINVQLALAEINDAIELLEAVDLHISDALPMLEGVFDDLDRRNVNRRALSQAIDDLEETQAVMVTRTANESGAVMQKNAKRSNSQGNRKLKGRARRG